MSASAPTRVVSPSPRLDAVAPSAAQPSRSEPSGGATLGRLGGVEVLRWPDDLDRRSELARRHEPCILLLDTDEPVPSLGELEDWVRDPIDTDELAVRCAALLRRAGCGAPPTLDDGLLLHRGAWAAIPPNQVAMVEMLLARLGRVVTRPELTEAAVAAGGSAHEEALKAAMARLGKRLAPLGLSLRAIRGRGYLLELTDACPIHGTRSAAETKGSST